MSLRRWILGGILLVLVVEAVIVGYDRLTAPFVGTVAVGAAPVAVAIDPRSGHAFVLNNASGTVSMLDAHSGGVLRTTALARWPIMLAVDAVAGRAFVFHVAGTMEVLDTASGDVLSTRTIIPRGSYILDVAVDEQMHRVLVTTSGSMMLVLDAWSGAMLLMVPVGHGAFIALDRHTDRAFLYDMSGGAMEVNVVDAATGRVLRTSVVGHSSLAAAVNERAGRVFVADNDDGRISVFDSTTGRLLGRLPVGPVKGSESLTGVAVTAQGRRLFVTDSDGMLYILDAAGTKVLHQARSLRSFYHQAQPLALVVDDRRGHVFVLDHPSSATEDSVSLLDAVSGRLLRRLPTGRFASAMALDETTGRLFVANKEGGDAHSARVSGAWSWVPGWLQKRLPWIPRLASSDSGSVSVLDTT